MRLSSTGLVHARSFFGIRCAGLSYGDIAEQFGMSGRAVGKVVHGESWAHVPGAVPRKRKTRRVLSPEQRVALVARYQATRNAALVAREFDVDPTTVAKYHRTVLST